MRIPSAVPQAYAACAHLSLLLLPRRVSASRVLVSLKMIRFLLVHALLESTYATCEPNRFKCDSSIGGDCCTARATDHEERRCRDGWIPIYTAVLPLLRRCYSCIHPGKGSCLRRAALSTELLPRPCTVPHRNIVLGRQQRVHLLLPDMFGNSCG